MLVTVFWFQNDVEALIFIVTSVFLLVYVSCKGGFIESVVKMICKHIMNYG